VLRKIVGRQRDEVTGEWRKLHEELNDLCFAIYYAGDQIEKNGMGGGM
jgi:hypothetical protein